MKRCPFESSDEYEEDDNVQLIQIGAERTKNVLILMSDTGGGHRASAEAAMLSRLNFGMNTGEVEAGLKECKPDIIISVYLLMQHIPLWVLKWQGLQKKVVFVTVIMDLNSYHLTWFHPGVNRCYCPSKEVAKRALVDGLKRSTKESYQRSVGKTAGA